jgi:hypothetical protein
MTEALQEFVDSRGIALRVDRERGVLRGVKLIGLASRNGRRYRDTALAEARPLYEEAKVNVNHPKDGPLAPRDYQDRLGVIRDVEFRTGEGLFGDLHFNPKHPLAEQLAWDAEHNPRNVGFSHNVLARVSREGDGAVVEEITRVQSVDLVADPAATSGLYEQEARGLAAQRGQAHFAPKTPQNEPDPGWDALTIAVLELHRPDLVEELRTRATQLAQQRLDEALACTTALERRQRVVELLCEHGLAITGHDDTARSVSRAFFEMLVQIEDQAQLRQVVQERAALVHRPRSREQTAIQSRLLTEPIRAADFAKAIKS